MGQNAPRSSLVIGFLSVIEYPQVGLVGGYLLLNQSGRPLEFHCTAPVKTNRAQEILFGATLEPYLYGEQIGQTLVSKGGIQAAVICTDRAAALAVREFVSVPAALVIASEEATARPTHKPAAAGDSFTALGSAKLRHRLDGPEEIGRPLAQFFVGTQSLAVSQPYAADEALVRQHLAGVTERFDLAEPFQRIREAIDEAQRSSR